MTQHTESALAWLNQARIDLKAGKDEFDTDKPAADAVCFHMVQAAEKYLKAYLAFCGHEAEQIRDLNTILEACRSLDPEFTVLTDAGVGMLTTCGTPVPEGGDRKIPGPDVISQAILLADKVRDFVEDKLTDLGLDINVSRITD